MSLQVRLPLNGNIENNGLLGNFTQGTAPSYTSEGKIGKALTTGSLVMSAEQTASVLNNNEVSFCFWIYPNADTGAGGGQLFGTDSMGANNNRKFAIFLYPTVNDIHLSWQNDSADNPFIVSVYSGAMPSYKWTHIAITYKNPTCTLYINGEKKATYTGTSSSSSFAYQTQLIHNSAKRRLNDFRMYNHCLSPKEIKEISKGLALHYPMNDPYIEPTINTYSGWSNYCYNAIPDEYNYGATTDMYYDTLDDVIKVRMGTNGLDAFPYVFFNDITPPSNGEYRTLSFDYYPTIKNRVVFYSWNTSGSITWVCNGIPGTGGGIPVNINSWNHLSVTIKNTGSASSGFGFMQIGTEKHTSSTSNYWLFKNIQIESKDHSTGYVGKNLSRTESLCSDCSGFGNNGTVRNQSSIYVERNSPRYTLSTVFNGTPYIIGQSLYGAKSTDALSLCAWINPSQVSSSYNIISSFEGGGGGLYISSGSIYFQIYSGGYVNVSGGNVSDNTWYHVVGTYDNSNLKIYVNGELKGQVSKTGAITYNSATPWSIAVNPGGTSDGGEHYYGKLSDVRIYATALSADDVKELYSISASIDKSGNIYAYEFREE